MTEKESDGWTNVLNDRGAKTQTQQEREKFLSQAVKANAEKIAKIRAHDKAQRAATIFALSLMISVAAGVYFDSLAIGFASFAMAMLWKT